jgi:small-conductance mechanosensitive channel
MWDNFLAVWNYGLISLSEGGTITVGQIVMVLVLLIVGVFASRRIERLIARRMAETHIQPDAAQLIQRLIFYALLVVLVVTALGLLHVPLTAFAFVSGAVAIGVGFGAQNVINNFISGWILMSERPVRIGDFVEIEGASGTVEAIGNRSTRIRRVDGVHLLVPNSRILENSVINWTLIDRQVRSSVKVGVAYGSPVREVERLLRQAVGEHAAVKPEPQPKIIFDDFGDNALIFDAYFWSDVGGERELRQIRSDIRFRICELFDEHGIVIAFPQRDVHLDSQEALRIRIVNEEQAT